MIVSSKLKEYSEDRLLMFNFRLDLVHGIIIIILRLIQNELYEAHSENLPIHSESNDVYCNLIQILLDCDLSMMKIYMIISEECRSHSLLDFFEFLSP